MSGVQLEALLAQVQQLTVANSKLQQELTNNSSHIARLESAVLQRRSTTSGEGATGNKHEGKRKPSTHLVSLSN